MTTFKLRFRHVYMIFGSVLTIAIMLFTDPDSGWLKSLPFGASTIASLIIMLNAILYVALLHFSRKALFDYLDFEAIAKRAMGTPEGAGKLAIALAIAMVAISITIYSAVH